MLKNILLEGLNSEKELKWKYEFKEEKRNLQKSNHFRTYPWICKDMLVVSEYYGIYIPLDTFKRVMEQFYF